MTADLSFFESIILQRKGRKDADKVESFFEIEISSKKYVVSEFMLGAKGVLWVVERSLRLDRRYQNLEKKYLPELHRLSTLYNMRPVELVPRGEDTAASVEMDKRYEVYRSDLIKKADPINTQRNILRRKFDSYAKSLFEHCKKRLKKYWESARLSGSGFTNTQSSGLRFTSDKYPPLEVLCSLPQINFKPISYNEPDTETTLIEFNE